MPQLINSKQDLQVSKGSLVWTDVTDVVNLSVKSNLSLLQCDTSIKPPGFFLHLSLFTPTSGVTVSDNYCSSLEGLHYIAHRHFNRPDICKYRSLNPNLHSHFKTHIHANTMHPPTGLGLSIQR